MSMPTFIITWYLSYKLITKMHCMTWYFGTCGITTMSLLYRLDNMVKCVCYMVLRSNGCFMANAALTSSHFRTDIISGMGHPRSNLVVLLVLCTVAYNIWGNNVVLQVPQDSTNPVENG
jgi:hypothetical protein